jgi:hypothetical protein
MSETNQTAIIITTGEKAIFDIFLEKDSFPRCVDLTGFDKFTVCLPLDAGGFLELTEIINANLSIVALIGGGTYGQLKVTVGPLDTKNLKIGFAQDIDIQWDVAATPAPNRKRLNKALNVEMSNCA